MFSFFRSILITTNILSILGQGHFGKVYTAINNETGDIMAMKEIPLQPNDHKTLRLVLHHIKLALLRAIRLALRTNPSFYS